MGHLNPKETLRFATWPACTLGAYFMSALMMLSEIIVPRVAHAQYAKHTDVACSLQ